MRSRADGLSFLLGIAYEDYGRARGLIAWGGKIGWYSGPMLA
jgi:hypothetical protein